MKLSTKRVWIQSFIMLTLVVVGVRFNAGVEGQTNKGPLNAAGKVTITVISLDGSVNTTGEYGVSLTFSRVSGAGTIPSAVVTHTDGTWSQTGFANGTTYKVVPSKTGFHFDPPFQSFSAARSDLNFRILPDTFSASGKVVDGAQGEAGLAGVFLEFRQQSALVSTPTPAKAQTDANGGWNQTGFQKGATYLVTPVKKGFVFSPTTVQFSNINNNVSKDLTFRGRRL